MYRVLVWVHAVGAAVGAEVGSAPPPLVRHTLLGAASTRYAPWSQVHISLHFATRCNRPRARLATPQSQAGKLNPTHTRHRTWRLRKFRRTGHRRRRAVHPRRRRHRRLVPRASASCRRPCACCCRCFPRWGPLSLPLPRGLRRRGLRQDPVNGYGVRVKHHEVTSRCQQVPSHAEPHRAQAHESNLSEGRWQD